MAKSQTIPVSLDELEALVDALDLLSKIDDGRLTSEFIQEKRLPSWDYSGGISDIVRHRNSAGYQVATTQRITDKDGSISHWHGKDIHIGEIVIYAKDARSAAEPLPH